MCRFASGLPASDSCVQPGASFPAPDACGRGFVRSPRLSRVSLWSRARQYPPSGRPASEAKAGQLCHPRGAGPGRGPSMATEPAPADSLEALCQRGLGGRCHTPRPGHLTCPERLSQKPLGLTVLLPLQSPWPWRRHLSSARPPPPIFIYVPPEHPALGLGPPNPARPQVETLTSFTSAKSLVLKKVAAMV